MAMDRSVRSSYVENVVTSTGNSFFENRLYRDLRYRRYVGFVVIYLSKRRNTKLWANGLKSKSQRSVSKSKKSTEVSKFCLPGVALPGTPLLYILQTQNRSLFPSKLDENNQF